MDGNLGVLVIADGGVASLLACASLADGRLPGATSDNPSASPVALWTPRLDPDTHGRRAAAVGAQADLYGFRVLHDAFPALPSHPADDEALNHALLRAGSLARANGAATVIWPATAGPDGRGGPDLDRIAGIVDRALLVSRLASIGSARPVEIRTPYADIPDPGLADLVLDMDLPIWTCWWAVEQPPADAAAAAELDHWTALLRAAGWSGAWPDRAPIVSTPPRPRAAIQEKGS